MNLEVDPDKVCKTVQEIRELIKDNILPRLTEIELEMIKLRRETWPVTQAISEQKAFYDANKYKRNYLGSIDPDEAEELLKRKKIILGHRFD